MVGPEDSQIHAGVRGLSGTTQEAGADSSSLVTSVLTLTVAMCGAASLSAVASRLRGLQAVPTPQRWHRTPTPLTGGIAIFGAFVAALLLPVLTGAVDARYLPLVLGAAAAFALGLVDDFRPIGVRSKLAGQFAVATCAAAAGVHPDWLPSWLGVPLAVLILVACMNSFNMLDHIDGLSAGTAAIAALGLALIAGLVPASGSSVVAAALAGACIGYLPFNYRPRRPAAIFMGDSGALMVGFTIGALALLASPGGAGGAAAAVAAPLLVLALPALDTGLVMLVRFSEGRPLWQGGRDHSSHRLVYHGMSDRRAVAVLLAIAANCTATAIAIVILDDVLLTTIAAGATVAALITFASQLVIIAERPKVDAIRPELDHVERAGDAKVA
jgi:UDP-GlcNAc:undecaprenyl-phosphate/decaprenyl-phosphate GlcNAc-1-phosphate transferase